MGRYGRWRKSVSELAGGSLVTGPAKGFSGGGIGRQLDCGGVEVGEGR